MATADLPAIFERFVSRLREQESSLWAMVAASVFLFVLFAGTLPSPERSPRRERRACLVALSGIGLTVAWQWRWLCDDAFITFRYAKNLAMGNGLVFNPGERVEGYTDFLWGVLLAGGIGAGQEPGRVSIVLGMASYVATIWLVAAMVKRVGPSAMLRFVPVAATFVALDYSFASFATSGLETMFGALLVTAALERAIAARPLASGTAGVLAAMAHPDHVLFYLGLGAAAFLTRRSARELARYLVPLLVLFVPYFAWRWSYYGDFWPNTFYAKSGDKLYFDQGVVYLLVSILGSGLWAVLPLAAFGLHARRRTLIGRYAILAVLPYLVYVAKVGGDFMLGRLLCSVMPSICILAEIGFCELLARRRLFMAAAALAAASCAVLPFRLIDPLEKAWHVADERTFYRLTSFRESTVDSTYYGWGKSLRSHFTDHGTRPMFAIGCVGMVGYLSELPLLDTFGLTDRGVAHTPIARRSRPGHEKSASAGYIWRRGAAAAEVSVFPAPYDAWTKFSVDGVDFHFARYDRELNGSLRGQSGVTGADVVDELDRYLVSPIRPPPDVAACDLWFFEQFYLSKTRDPLRADRLHQLMIGRGVLDEQTVDFAAGDEPPPGWRRVDGIDFEYQPSETIEAGNAFDVWPSSKEVVGQDAVVGADGKFIDTFQKELGDGATGRLQVPVTLRGDVPSVRVAGGRDPSKLRVALWVDGTMRASATGCNTEILGVRAWNISAFKGKHGFIEIADEADGGWGHIIVDRIAQWARARS